MSPWPSNPAGLTLPRTTPIITLKASTFELEDMLLPIIHAFALSVKIVAARAQGEGR